MTTKARNKKLIVFVLVIVTMLLIFTTNVSAGDFQSYSVYRLDSGELFATGPQMNISQALRHKVNVQRSQFLYAYNNNLYSMMDAFQAYSEAGGQMDSFRVRLSQRTPHVSSDRFEVIDIR